MWPSSHLPNLSTMAPTEKDPAIPPTLKMATAKLHTMVLLPGLKGSPYRSIDTFWKNLRSFCPTEGENAFGFRMNERIYYF